MEEDKKTIFETTAIVRGENELMIEVPLPFSTDSRVKVSISIDDDSDFVTNASSNPAFKDIFEEKEIYTLEDGKPFNG